MIDPTKAADSLAQEVAVHNKAHKELVNQRPQHVKDIAEVAKDDHVHDELAEIRENNRLKDLVHISEKAKALLHDRIQAREASPSLEPEAAPNVLEPSIPETQ